MKIKIYVTLLILLLTSAVVVAQNQQRVNLATVLNQLSDKYNVKISFSPSLTLNVFPKNTQTDGGIEVALTMVLNNTGFAFKKMGSAIYYVYKNEAYKSEEKPATVKPKPQKAVPVKEEPIPDTVRMHTVLVPIAGNIKHVVGHKTPSIVLPDIPRPTPIKTYLPLLAVKTNLLYDAMSTFNLGAEVGLAPKWTLDISGNYNPWTFSGNRKMKHWMIQPEARYWLSQRFSGHFFGLHTHYAQFNVGGMLPWGFNSGKMFGSIENENILNYRYQGWLVGAGIGYGYHWVLGNRWRLEAEIDAGYAYLNYDKYRCEKCSEKLKGDDRHYLGPTKVAVTLVFMIQ